MPTPSRHTRTFQAAMGLLAASLFLGSAAIARAADAPAAAPAPAKEAAPAGKHGKAGKVGHAKANRPDKDRDAKLIDTATADLNLTADQKSKISTLLKDFAKAKEAYLADHQAEINDLRTKAKAAQESNDKAAARDAGQKLKSLLSNAHNGQFQVTVSKIRDVLTPEQQTRFDAKMLELGGQGKKMKGEGAKREGRKADKAGKVHAPKVK